MHSIGFYVGEIRLTLRDSIIDVEETRKFRSRVRRGRISMEISSDSGGRHLCVTHINLLVTIKSLYSILLMPFLISRCIDDTFSISLLLYVSLLLLRAINTKTPVAYLEGRSRGSFVTPPTVMFSLSTLSKYLFCMSMNEMGLTNSTTLLPPSPVDIKRDTKRMTGEDARFYIFAKFISQNEGRW